MKIRKTAKVTLHGGLNFLRRPDACMIQTNINGDRSEHWITPPGVRIEPKVAAQIKLHPQVKAGKDALFPGLDQTWRIGGDDRND
jgi:hypothetical protein